MRHPGGSLQQDRGSHQTDDEFRPDEIVGVAIGLRLRGSKSPLAESFTARLGSDFPNGEDWVVIKPG